MGGRAAPVEQAGGGEQERAGADGCDAARAFGPATSQATERGRRGRLHPPSAGDDQRVQGAATRGRGATAEPDARRGGNARAAGRRLAGVGGGPPASAPRSFAEAKTCSGPVTSSNCTSGKVTISTTRPEFGEEGGDFVISAKSCPA